jgi:hypothetical protein
LLDTSKQAMTVNNGNIAKWESAIDELKTHNKGRVNYQPPYLLLMSIGVLALSASVIAGGDDRDRGPVESLDAIASPTQTICQVCLAMLPSWCTLGSV